MSENKEINKKLIQYFNDFHNRLPYRCLTMKSPVPVEKIDNRKLCLTKQNVSQIKYVFENPVFVLDANKKIYIQDFLEDKFFEVIPFDGCVFICENTNKRFVWRCNVDVVHPSWEECKQMSSLDFNEDMCKVLLGVK